MTLFLPCNTLFTPTMKSNPNILIVEDHDIVVAAIEMVLIENFPKASLQKAGSFPKGLRLLETAPAIDLVILDVDIPGGESYLMIEKLRNIRPGVRILIFTGQEEHRHAIRFLKAGANGFLSKNALREDCVKAIKMVLNNKKYVSEAVQQLIANTLFDRPSHNEEDSETSLSNREEEIVDLLMQGKWTKDIAVALGLSPTTVSTHKAKIFQKMGVSNVIDLFKKLNPVERVANQA